MDILFVNPQDSMSLRKEVNGQLLLGTLLLQAGFDVDILRFCQVDGFGGEYKAFVRNAAQMIAAMDPKAVSFYSLWPDYHITLRIAKELKAARPDIYVIFAGPQPSATARDTMETMPFVDAVCSGEGEGTVVPFFTALLHKGGAGLNEIPGLYYRENGAVVCPDKQPTLCNLNTLPHWDDRLYLKHYKDSTENLTSKTYYMPIDAGRGCPFKCSFCYANALRKRSYRMKTPERIVEDIRFFKEKFGITSFWFTHDAYTTNKKLVEQVCDYLIREKMDITWRCTARLDCLDKDLILKMKQAGLTEIEVGVETGSQRMQKVVQKNLDLAMVRENVRFLAQEHIVNDAFFMYGFPEETEQDLFDTVQLAMDLIDAGVRRASMSFCRFNPTTQLTVQYLDQLVLDPSIDVLTRDIYGYEDEIDVIANNRSQFSFYYHLETPERKTYQYLICFLRLYQMISLSRRHLRQAFDFDAAKLVRAFFNANRACFSGGLDEVTRWMLTRSRDLLCNAADQLNQPWVEQLKAVIRFDLDQHMLKKTKGSSTQIGEYAFRYEDLKQHRPITEFGEGTSKILMQKKDGKVSLMLLKH